MLNIFKKPLKTLINKKVAQLGSAVQAIYIVFNNFSPLEDILNVFTRLVLQVLA